MSLDSHTASLFTQVDITAGSQPLRPTTPGMFAEEHLTLLRSILAAQDRTNELLEEMVSQAVEHRRQRHQELTQWKDANPLLAESCKYAAESLTRVQTSYLDQITRDISDNEDHMIEGEFAFNEFVDRYGPRLAQLNGVIQVLAMLGSATAAPQQQE
jgi:hypothetical protein